MLKPLGASLGEIYSLSESSSYQPIKRYMNHGMLARTMSADVEASPEAYSEGDLEIKASVNAKFLIRGRISTVE